MLCKKWGITPPKYIVCLFHIPFFDSLKTHFYSNLSVWKAEAGNNTSATQLPFTTELPIIPSRCSYCGHSGVHLSSLRVELHGTVLFRDYRRPTRSIFPENATWKGTLIRELKGRLTMSNGVRVFLLHPVSVEETLNRFIL